MVPHVEQVAMLRRHLAEPGCRLHLFTNDRRPSKGDQTLGAYAEPDEPGYAPIELDEKAWTFTADGPEGPIVASYPAQVFRLEADTPVYGYVITGPTGRIKMAERELDAPVRNEAGAELHVTPRLILE